MSFFDEISKIDIDKFRPLVDSRTDADVERALSKSGPLDVEDFAALISENARIHYLKDMAQMSMQLTRRRFGRTVNMYLPLYLTNLCTNKCKYCGFSSANKFKRTVLTLDEIREECEAINKLGDYPEIHAVCYVGKLSRNKYRRINIKEYSIFYCYDKYLQITTVTDIYHSKQDIISLLH